MSQRVLSLPTRETSYPRNVCIGHISGHKSCTDNGTDGTSATHSCINCGRWNHPWCVTDSEVGTSSLHTICEPACVPIKGTNLPNTSPDATEGATNDDKMHCDNDVCDDNDEQVNTRESASNEETESEADSDSESEPDDEYDDLGDEDVDRIIVKANLSLIDKKRILSSYCCDSFNDLVTLAKGTVGLTCDRSYKAILKGLYVDKSLKSREDIVKGIQDKSIVVPEARNLDDGITEAHCLALCDPDGLNKCYEFAEKLDPSANLDARAERRVMIKAVIEDQRATRRTEGGKKLKNQFFSKMIMYIKWCLFIHKITDDDCGFTVPSPPFSKHAYGIEFISGVIEARKDDGEIKYKHSSVAHFVQALNCVYEREKVMFPKIVTWGRPGEAVHFKSLLQKAKDRVNIEKMKTFADRGKNSHMDKLKGKHIVQMDHFFTSLDVELPFDELVDKLEEIGVPLPENEESREIHLNAVMLALRKAFPNYLQMFSFWAMRSVLHNTYLRGQQGRCFDLCDISLLDADGLGSCNIEGFEPPKLLTYCINSSKRQGGDETWYTHVGRHRNVEECAVKVQAFYLVAAYSEGTPGITDIRPLPDFSDNSMWYDHPLFVINAANVTTPMKYATHLELTHHVNLVLGINTGDSVTHADRGLSDENPAPLGDVARLGGWKNKLGCFETTYKGAPAFRAIRGRTGFPLNSTNWYLPRQSLYIYQGDEYFPLVLCIFPFLQEWKQQLKDPVWRREGCHDTYFSAEGVAAVFEYLAIVFLQDAVLLKQKYPDFVLYKHMVFDHPLWPKFRDALRQKMESREGTLEYRSVHKHQGEVQEELDRLYKHLDYAGKEQDNNMHKVHETMKATLEVVKQGVNQMNQVIKRSEGQAILLNRLANVVYSNQAMLLDIKRMMVSSVSGNNIAITSSATNNEVTAEERLVVPVDKISEVLIPESLLSPTNNKMNKIEENKQSFQSATDKLKAAHKCLVWPNMTDHPKKIHHLFYCKKFGEFIGIIQVQEAAKALNIKKNKLMSSDIEGSKTANRGIIKKVNQLRRVADVYEKCRVNARKEKIPDKRTLDVESFFRERTEERFFFVIFESGCWKAGQKFGTHSLQNFALYLQKLASGNEKKSAAKEAKEKKKPTVTELKQKSSGKRKLSCETKKSKKRKLSNKAKN